MSEPCAMVRGITAVAGCQSRAYVAAAEITVDGMPPQVCWLLHPNVHVGMGLTSPVSLLHLDCKLPCAPHTSAVLTS